MNDDQPVSDGDASVELTLYIDEDLVRAGLDPSTLAGENLRVEFSERLSADPWFVVVAVGAGWRIFDAITKQAASRAVDTLLAFVQSREKRLKLECEIRRVDPRVDLVMASIATASREEFDRALRLVSSVELHVRSLLERYPGAIREIYFVWQEGQWVFTYYIDDAGDIVKN